MFFNERKRDIDIEREVGSIRSIIEPDQSAKGWETERKRTFFYL